MLLLLITGERLVSSFSFNLAGVVLNKTLWRGEQTARDRQEALAMTAKLLEVASGKRSSSSTEAVLNKECSMIPSMVIADDYRRQKDLKKAAFWLHHAATTAPYPSLQHAVLLPGWIQITPQGNLVVDWSISSWHFRSDSQLADLAIDEEYGWLALSYRNKLGQRDKVIYEWKGPLQLSYWHTLQLRARVHPGTYLTFETHSDTGVERHLNYYGGTGRWETFSIPLNVDKLRYIYISISEPSPDSLVLDYAVDIEPLTFLLDEAAGVCQ
jgi:hypothetical protein